MVLIEVMTTGTPDTVSMATAGASDGWSDTVSVVTAGAPDGWRWCGECVESFLEKKVSDALFLYVPPILILLGTIGNILTIVVLHVSRTYRGSPTVVGLIALALADIGLLNTGLLMQTLDQNRF